MFDMSCRNVEFYGRVFRNAVPRYFNGKYMLLEFTDSYVKGIHEPESIFIVCLRSTRFPDNEEMLLTLAVFALRQEAEKYIHDKERLS